MSAGAAAWPARALPPLALLALAAALWWQSAHTAAGAVPAGAPPWATLQDHLLDGPDAGWWAWQAQALQEGTLDRLDPHRMPTWTLATVAMAWLTGLSNTLAGHLVNHLAAVLVGPVTYALGRLMGMSRPSAFVAGLLVLLCPAVVLPSRRFGIDAVVSFAWPSALLVALAAGARPWLAPLAGVAAGLACATHFTTLPAPVPLALAALVFAPRGERLKVAAGFGLGLVGTLAVVASLLPIVTPDVLVRSIVEGIAPVRLEAQPSADVLASRAWDTFGQGARGAVGVTGRWLSQSAGADALPTAIVPVLLSLGVTGLGLATGNARPRGRSGRTMGPFLATGLPAGIVPLLLLAPVPVLAAAGAQPRYMDNLAPIAILLVVRGIAALGACVDTAVGARAPRWPTGAGQAAAAAAFALACVRPDLRGSATPPVAEDQLVVFEAARTIRATFGPGVDLATVMPELAASTGAWDCPHLRVCPAAADEPSYRSCLQAFARDCRGDGDIPYVIVVQTPADGRPTARKAMDAWVEARWPVTEIARGKSMRVRLARIDRAAAAAGGLGVDASP
jgi:hypothetical protein